MNRFSTSHRQYVVFRPALWFIFVVFGFLLVRAMPASAQNGYPPRADPYINDFAKVIDAEDANNLCQALADLKSSKGIELAVVTVNSIKDYPTGDATFEAFATHLFNTWGIGDAQRNNGVMLLVAVKDHKLRVELGKGYGSGHSAEMQSIIDNTIVPDFKQGAYSRGIYRGVKAIADQLAGGKQTQPASAPPQPLNTTTGSTQSRSPLENLILIMVFGLIAALIGVAWGYSRLPPRCSKCKGRMIHLDDNTKLTHLDAGQQREQAIKSVEYDVWLCPTCGATTVKTNLLSSSYISCPQCHYETLLVEEHIKRGPTQIHPGLSERSENCANCGYIHNEKIVLPVLEVNYSSSSAPASESNSDSGKPWDSGRDSDSVSIWASADHDDNDRGSSSGGGASGSW